MRFLVYVALVEADVVMAAVIVAGVVRLVRAPRRAAAGRSAKARRESMAG